MDLSRLKWPLIIVVAGFAFWLVSEGGVNWMYKNLTATAPGADVAADVANEAGLSRLGGFLMKTFRYSRAKVVLEETCKRYPQGKNYYYDTLHLAKIEEKLGNVPEALKKLEFLMQVNASAIDPRVPDNDILQLRHDKLMEVNELGEVGGR